MIIKVNAKVWECTECRHRWFSRGKMLRDNKPPSRCPNSTCRKQEKLKSQTA